MRVYRGREGRNIVLVSLERGGGWSEFCQLVRYIEGSLYRGCDPYILKAGLENIEVPL